MEQLLHVSTFDAISNEAAVDIYNTVVPWLQHDDSRMPIAYGVLEALATRTSSPMLRAVCYEARAVYYSEKDDPIRCLECLLEGLEICHKDSIQKNVRVALQKVRDPPLFKRVLDLIERADAHTALQQRDLLLFTVMIYSYDMKDTSLVHRALGMLGNRSLAALYHGTLDITPCYSEEDVKQRYMALMGTLDLMLSDPEHIDCIVRFHTQHPQILLQKAGFHMSYTMYNTRAMQEKLATMYLQIMPYLRGTAMPARRLGVGKRRIGFVNSHLRDHTIAKMFGGVIKHIDRSRFDPYVYVVGDSTHFEPYATKHTPLCKKDTLQETLEVWRTTIREDALDVLIYPDIGMNDYTYYLSFSRLAPVQAMWWGHTDSAATCIDYFISSKHFDDHPDQYAERLLKVDGLSVIFEKPLVTPDATLSRTALGLPATGTIYMCVQTIFKWGPAFNEVLCGILQADPSAWIVGINIFHHDYWKDMILKQVHARVGAEATSRILLLPPQEFGSFLSLCQHATVMLDTFPFSGSTTHLECFGMGKMAITLCTPTLRGSLCTGVYRALGLDTSTPSPIAYTPQEYIAKAVYFAHDSRVRGEFEEKLVSRMEGFYQSPQEIRAWNDMLEHLTTI